MRWLLTLTALTVASVAFAQCPSGQCAAQVQVRVRVAAPPPVVTYELPAPRVTYYTVPAPAVRYYEVPVAYAPAAVVYTVRPERRYATPVRDFFFGK